MRYEVVPHLESSVQTETVATLSAKGNKANAPLIDLLDGDTFPTSSRAFIDNETNENALLVPISQFGSSGSEPSSFKTIVQKQSDQVNTDFHISLSASPAITNNDDRNKATATATVELGATTTTTIVLLTSVHGSPNATHQSTNDAVTPVNTAFATPKNTLLKKTKVNILPSKNVTIWCTNYFCFSDRREEIIGCKSGGKQ